MAKRVSDKASSLRLVRASEPKAPTKIINKLCAFTLAEVLITLAIIGVVAALTIPTVVRNYQKQQFVSGMLKAYATLTQAFQMSQIENGALDTWDFTQKQSAESTSHLVETYILPYLKVAKNCGTRAGEGCFAKGVVYKNLNGTNRSVFDDIVKWAYKVVLASGESMYFGYTPNCIQNNKNCFFIHVDTNGAKKPNQIGRDVFGFFAFPHTNDVQPLGMYNNPYNPATKRWTKMTKEEIYEGCNTTVELTSDNFCAARIMLDGKKMLY